MPKLVGLPDTKRAKSADFVTSAAQVAAILRKGHAATQAGDTGAINVWIDDNGKYRCELQRRMIVHDAQTFTNLRDVRQWVRDTLPTIE